MNANLEKVKSIFLNAVDRYAPDEWSRYLDEACGEDAELRHHVEVLLDAHASGESLLDKGAIAAAPTLDQPITERPGTVIGPYKLLQEIGHGGMGVVYMAEQTEPVERRVALKIIKPGMDTRQVIARFEAERQALAMMDHPNIAKVLDAGTTDSGRPFFVMELVKGIPITQYCDEHQLSPRERLELFVPVCHAVQHAHQKGIIHRDIKPSNVMVCNYDDRPMPKIIDFGVAKATDHRLTEKTMFTEFGQVVGTPEYMSPEQARLSQLDIDTRSDIYSLGVLLYELLVGETPFDRTRMRSAAFDELLRIIREEEPPKPSVRLSSSHSLPSIAANRHTEPRKLGTLVRGELDWIVMKAMEKDRTRRYETATGFSADIERYLSDEPVQACPPSAVYRFKKFARRHKIVIATTTAIAFSLVVGISVATWQAVRATKAERNAEAFAEDAAREASRAQQAEHAAVAEAARADQEADKARTQAAIAQAVNDFLNEDLLGVADAATQLSLDLQPDPDIKLRTVVDRAAERIKGKFTDEPMVEASLHGTLGSTYLNLGEYEKAESHQRRASEIRKSVLGPENPATLRSMMILGNAINKQGRHAEAEIVYRQVLEAQNRVLGREHSATLTSTMNLANAINTQGRHAEAEALQRQVLKARESVLGREHPATLVSMMNLANAIYRQERFEEAEKAYREVLEVQKRVLGPNHPYTLSTKMNLALPIDWQERHAEAEAIYHQVMEIQERVLGSEHPSTLLCRRNLVRCYTLWSKEVATTADSSERDAQKAVQLALKAVELNPDIALSWDQLGVAECSAGNWEAAVEAFKKADGLPEHGKGYAQFFAAAAHWQSGDQNRACKCFLEASAWLYASPGNTEHYHLSREAGEVIPAEVIVDYCTAKLADDSESSELHWQRGAAYARHGDDAAAAADFIRAMELTGASRWNETKPAFRALVRLEPVFARVAELRPEDDGLWRARGRHHARCARWENAVADYARVIGRPRPHGLWADYAYLLLLADDHDEYREVCRQLDAEFGDTEDATEARNLAVICSLSRDSRIAPARIVRWAELADTQGRNKYTLRTLGMACYRSGEFDLVVKYAEKSLREYQGSESNLASLLALAYHQLGQDEKSREWYGRDLNYFRQIVPKSPEVGTSLALTHWLNINLWHGEARMVLEPASEETT